MGNFISYHVKKVKARGLNRTVFPQEDKIKKYLFDEEYQQLGLLEMITPFSLLSIRMLYPGAGADLLFPLYYVNHFFPGAPSAHFIFVDKDNNLPLIKTVLDDIGIPFSAKKNQVRFYWKRKLITVECVEGDIFGNEHEFEFNVYFEKAFRIIKYEHKEYEQKIFEKLPLGGIIIADSGFENILLKKIDVPLALSSYGEMVIGVKE